MQYWNIVGVLFLGAQKYKLEDKVADVTEEGCCRHPAPPKT